MKVQLTRPELLHHNAAWELSRQLVTHPDSTYLISLEGRCSQWGILVVDREARPKEGAILLISTKNGFALKRWHKNDPADGLWGVVTWIIRRP